MSLVNDPAVMRLAHPLRCTAAQPEFLGMMRQAFGERTWKALSDRFQEAGQLTSVVVTQLCNEAGHETLRQLVQNSTRLPGGTELGNVYPAMVYLRHMLAPQPYFVIEDELVRLMERTDIARDIPVSMLNFPYPRFYVEFGQTRCSSLFVPNVTSGLHILEGAYCELGTHPEQGEGLFILMSGSPLGKEDAMDDATYSLFLATSDKDRLLQDALDVSFMRGQRVSAELGLRASTQEMYESGMPLLLFLTKVLLYIGLPDIRRELHKDKSDWEAATKALKSPGKRTKAERKGRSLVDHVLICAPPEEAPGEGSGPTGRSVRSHWRRGHYRMQPFGPQLSKRRVVFIRPILVHAGSDHETTPPEYVVR